MSKLITNYVFTVLYQVLLMLTPFITTPYVSRVLRAEGVGIDAYVVSIVQLFIVFIVLSLPMYGSRQIAVQKDQKGLSKEFWSIFSFQIVIAIINVVVFLFFIGTVSEYKQLYYIHLLTLAAYSIDISWYFIGKEEMKKIAIRNMLVKVSGIILIFMVIKDMNDLPLYVAINGGTLLIGQIIMWRPLLKELSFVKVTFQDIKSHVTPILSLFLPQLMIQVYVLVNRIVLGNISGEVEVGFYNQANKVVKIAIGVIASLGTVLLPRMASEFSKGNMEEIRKYTNYTMQFVLMVTLPMTLGLMAIAPNFVVWFLGDEFLDVSTVLILMSPVIFFVGLANVFGIQILVATNQQKKYSIAITVGAILSLIINFFFVSSLASLATTIALLVAEGVGAIIQMYFARKYFVFRDFFKLFTKYLLLSTLVYLSASLIGYYVTLAPVLLTLLQVAVGALLYLLGLVLIKDSMVFKFVEALKGKVLRGRA
ncbi:oligosaccharide flippase family protein [Robertmurraya korlensis]|uniref:oligosaccharide flippase family protein n=1 Tax=Robertmurraya korlensis TaxID=519977 RepID=UPI00203CCEFC|nr:oligosaccharide flippase family protein [Robertmurraya korlensis]MCM3602677.1 oligosaccharide flippase family protein [Robertmurraya korlensis]